MTQVIDLTNTEKVKIKLEYVVSGGIDMTQKLNIPIRQSLGCASEFKCIRLLNRSIISNLDLMSAETHEGNFSLYLGHFNDGIV